MPVIARESPRSKDSRIFGFQGAGIRRGKTAYCNNGYRDY